MVIWSISISEKPETSSGMPSRMRSFSSSFSSPRSHLALLAKAVDREPEKAPLGRSQMARQDAGQALEARLAGRLDPRAQPTSTRPS